MKYDTQPLIIPSCGLSDLPEVQQALKALKGDLAAQRNKAAGDELSGPAHDLLHAAAAHPWAPSATLWKFSKKMASPQTQLAVCRELFNTGLAESEQVRIGSANVLLYRISIQGWAYLGMNTPTHQGRGAIAHQHISHWAAMCGELDGHKSWVEWQEPGSRHAVDAAVQIATNLFDVIEVMVEAENNITGHLEKLSASAFVRNIIIVRTQKQLLKETQDALRDEPVVRELGGRLRWVLAETLLRRCFP